MLVGRDSAYGGLVITDLLSDTDFMQRALRPRDAARSVEAICRLSDTVAKDPDSLLQELARAAVDICSADSAVIHSETIGATDDHFYKWIAAAGEYSRYLHTTFPRGPSACSICLERGTPQRFRVSREYFDMLGKTDMPVITDGIMLPWHVEDVHGTLFIAAHGRDEAFDREDYRTMELLARFAAADFQRRQRHGLELEQARAEGEASMAVDVARRISAPLRTMQVIATLTQRSRSSVEAKLFAEELTEHMNELSALVRKLTRGGKKLKLN